MRKHFISAVIGGLMGPIAGLCTALDIATIRNIALVQGAVAGGPGGRRVRKPVVGRAGDSSQPVEPIHPGAEAKTFSR